MPWQPSIRRLRPSTIMRQVGRHQSFNHFGDEVMKFSRCSEGAIAGCPIWGTVAELEDAGGRDGVMVHSARTGGTYFIGNTAIELLKSCDDRKKVLLTSWLVEQRRLGDDRPDVTDTTLDAVTHRRPHSVPDRADNLLRYLDMKTDFLGTELFFKQETLYEALAWTASRRSGELTTLAEYAKAQGWIEFNEAGYLLKLKPLGYARLAALDSTGSAPSQAFVAIWFDMPLATAYEEGIAPAIRDAGYEPIWIDQKDHNNKIDDEIIAEIRRSRFLVADFTQGDAGARGGVYYEAGFAHGLNLPVIFTCRADAIEKVHFRYPPIQPYCLGNHR